MRGIGGYHAGMKSGYHTAKDGYRGGINSRYHAGINSGYHTRNK